MTDLISRLDNRAACSSCGRELLSNADAPTTKSGKISKLNYCRLCGMETDAGKFCCSNCEYKFKKFVRGQEMDEVGQLKGTSRMNDAN